LRVLVVDDNEDAALTLAECVKALGHEVRVAFDGEEALRMAKQLVPDAVLLDIGMPVLDGYQVAARLRQDPAFLSTRIVAITAYGTENDIQAAMAAGFDVHLLKPVDFPVIATLLGSYSPGIGLTLPRGLDRT
jgi:CheY-like chemotaxis protein